MAFTCIVKSDHQKSICDVSLRSKNGSDYYHGNCHGINYQWNPNTTVLFTEYGFTYIKHIEEAFCPCCRPSEIADLWLSEQSSGQNGQSATWLPTRDGGVSGTFESPLTQKKIKYAQKKINGTQRAHRRLHWPTAISRSANYKQRPPFVVLTVIINLSCRTTKIIYSVKISLTYGILLHANVTTRVPRY